MTINAKVIVTMGDAKSIHAVRLSNLEMYGQWMQTFHWKWWVTLTFSNDLSRERANVILKEYLNELEAKYHDSFSCLIAQEQKTFSGSGKSAGRVHFHLLVGCAANLTVRAFTDLWQQSRFGGKGTSGSSAHVEPYDPEKDAAYYCFKLLQDRSWDWDFHNLEMVSATPPMSAQHNARTRRKLHRRAERQALFAREKFSPSVDKPIRRHMG
jgi:hypothetical protein